MQFSDVTNDTGLVQHIDFLVGTNVNNFPLNDKAREMNRHYYNAVIAAWKASGDWDFDDTSQANFPIATDDLVNSQNDYALPVTALKLKRVEVLDSGGNSHVLVPLDDRQIPGSLDEFYKTDSLPQYYRVLRGSIWLYPAPATASVTITDGLKIYFLREVDEFVAGDTTQEPGIPEPFHDILSIGAAYNFALAKGRDNVNILKNELEQKMGSLREFMASRHENFDTRVRVRRIKPQ